MNGSWNRTAEGMVVAAPLFLVASLMVLAGAVPEGASAQEPAASASVPLVRAIDFVGKFHPVVLHFPIALVLTALLGEILGLVSGKPFFFQTARFTLILAALSALVTVPLGWSAAASKDYTDDYAHILLLHRWCGTATGILTILTACLSELSHFRHERAALRAAYRIGLVAASVTITFTGHFGALLVYGLDYFSG